MLLKQEVIGQHVRRLRRRAGLTTRALGRKTGFSASFISQLENGKVSPLRSISRPADEAASTLTVTTPPKTTRTY